MRKTFFEYFLVISWFRKKSVICFMKYPFLNVCIYFDNTFLDNVYVKDFRHQLISIARREAFKINFNQRGKTSTWKTSMDVLPHEPEIITISKKPTIRIFNCILLNRACSFCYLFSVFMTTKWHGLTLEEKNVKIPVWFRNIASCFKRNKEWCITEANFWEIWQAY